ncbi:MAG TPA: HEAT repeat domain-containing protein [Planctomycetaceae bacterium]|nr:HEAT repeat domain-containing protein [Planctomycetaceae bacterium]
MRRRVFPTVALVAVVMGAGCNQSVIPGTAVPAAPVAPGTNVPVGQVSPGVQAAPVDPAVNAANKAQYEKSVAQSALERAHTQIKDKYGAQKVAVVVVEGVPGPEADADHYIERKIFKAAYADYEAGQKSAQAQTEANRKAAEEKAASENSGFGMVWYRYKAVRSDVPYPQVSGGAASPGRHVYYTGPVSDLQAFAGRLKFGNVLSTDPNSRVVTVQSFIPSPIPDIDEEELYIQHGKENVLTVDISNAEGDADRVSYFLETQLKECQPDGGLIVVGPRVLSPGKFRAFVAPVKDLNDFTARITFGSIADLDVPNRKLAVNSQIPADLPKRPTPAELAEMRREEREGDERPKKGETEVDWAIRVLKKGDESWSVKKVLKALATMEADPDRLNDVSDALTDWATTSKWTWHNSKDLFAAMDTWSTEKSVRYLVAQLNESGWDKGAIVRVLAKHPSEAAARGVATVMTDRSHAVAASTALRDMGPVAEDTVLKLAQDQHASMRIEAYDILRTIGTKKSVPKLKGNLSKEKDKVIRDNLRSVIEDIETRLATEGDSPFKVK